MHTHTHNDYGCYVVATLLLFLAGFFNIEGSNDQHKRTRSTKNESYITITAGDITDLILSMDQGKSGGLCSNSGTLNWHFEGLIHWREPEGLGDEIVFWIDCSICGEWAHNLCAFGKNSITRQYVCINC